MEEGRRIKGNLWQRVCLNLSYSDFAFGCCIFMITIGLIFFAFALVHSPVNLGGRFISSLIIFWLIVVIVFYVFLNIGIKKHVVKITECENFYYRDGTFYRYGLNLLIKGDDQGRVLEFDRNALLNDGHKIIEIFLLEFDESKSTQKLKVEKVEHELKIGWDFYQISVLFKLTFKIRQPFDMQEVYDIFGREKIRTLDAYFINQLKNTKTTRCKELAKTLQGFVIERNSAKLLEFLQLFSIRNEFSNIEMITFEIKPDSISYSRILTQVSFA